MKVDNIITGLIQIEIEGESITFYKDENYFTFMRNNTSNINPLSIKTNNGYILGITHEGKAIAIYIGYNTFELYRTIKMRIRHYLLSNTVLIPNFNYEFDTIEFYGGTLNSLFSPKRVSSVSEQNSIAFDNNDLIEYCIRNDYLNGKMSVSSNLIQEFGGEGVSISNKGVFLSFEFIQAAKLQEVYNYYLKTCRLLSFMTYRQNVGFEKITLKNNNFSPNFYAFELFVNTKHEITEKGVGSNITFEDLGEHIVELINVIYYEPTNKNDRPIYLFDFIPKYDLDVFNLNNERIKNICSSLECEYRLSKDKDIIKEPNLCILIDEVKETIEKHQLTENRIDEEICNSLLSSVSQWSFPLKTRIFKLYTMYKSIFDKVELALCKDNDLSLDHIEKCISQFVKHRNLSSHDGITNLNHDLYFIAYILTVLLYICVLHRIGLDNQQICDLINEYKICS